MRFFTTERLGETQSLTPEGFLLCEDVPIARTGEMIYGPQQTTLPTGPEGVVHIRRTDREVFRPQTIASFEGKPFVLDHPDQPDPDRWTVDPFNWASVAKGHVIGPRRGTGSSADLIIADLLVTDDEAIQEIRKGRREVSCGYIADYVCDDCGKVEDAATWNQCVCLHPRGYGQQIGILGNHVALVDSARCGPRCAIGDRAVADSAEKENAMKWLETIKEAWKAKDQKAFDEALAGVPAGQRVFITKDGVCDAEEEEKEKKKDTEDQVPPQFKKKEGTKDWADAAAELEKRADKTEDTLDRLSKDVKDIKDELFKFKKTRDEEEEEEEEKKKDAEDEGKEVEEEAKVGTGDRARKAHDSALLEDSFQETIAMAEILSPGFRIPTFDRSDAPTRTVATICRTRRAVLDLAYGQAEMRSVIDELLHGRPVQPNFVHDKALTCDTVRFVFRAAAVVKKQRNNQYQPANAIAGVGGGTGVRGVIKTPADFNRRMQEYWKDK